MHGYTCITQARTGFVSVPSRSISTVTSSPSARKSGGSRKTPTPAGVPVSTQIAGLERDRLGHERDHLGDGEDHVRGGRVLAHLAVDEAPDPEALRVADLGSGHELADRPEACRATSSA